MTRKLDAITLEVVNHALGSIADEMALVIMRTAYSAIVRDSMDYSTGICDRHGRVVAHGLTMALHLGSFPDAMEAMRRDLGEAIHEGDVYVFNDPYTCGGMHLPDVYVVKPIFVAGELEGFAATVVHQIDMGGIAPGSTAVYSTEIFQEGLRLPVIRMYDRGVPNETFFRIMALNTRVPEKLAGDMRAQVAACRGAERAYARLVERYGSDAFRQMLDDLHDYAERVARAEIADLPDGRWTFTDWLDGTGDEPEPIVLTATVTIAGDELTVDWTGSAPQVRSAINCPPSFVKAAAHLMLKCVARREIPNFEGFCRPLHQVLPEGSIVNPRAPAACAARAIIGWRAIDVLMGVFAQIVPERLCAAGEGGVSFASISGFGPDGRRFVCSETHAGSWGAMPHRDGVFGIPNAGGNVTNQPVEMIEAQFPLAVERYGMVPDSGGPGRFRGAPAYVREYRALADDTMIVMRSDRRRWLPFGLDGGLPGTPSFNIVDPGDRQRLVPVMPMGPVMLTKGQRFCHIGAGGGGWGDPLERDPARCLDDLMEERFSPEYLAEVYGVVLTPAGQVDLAATETRRRAMRAAAGTGNSSQPSYLRRFLAPLGIESFRLDGERELRFGAPADSSSHDSSSHFSSPSQI
ncbi:MAG: hydantoinase B/oxoprolinase family protein [Lautropia sp.]